MSDQRRRQYVPLYVHFATGPTGQKIISRYGAAGLGVWASLLAASKRSSVQGTFEWVSESDAWRHLGINASPPDFTFADFVAFLGRNKLASTRRYGEVKQTSISAWKEWNQTIYREQDAAKKSRKRAQNTRDNTRDKTTTIRGTEGEYEYEPPNPHLKKIKTRQKCHLCSYLASTDPDDLPGHLEDNHGIVTPAKAEGATA